MLVDDTLSVVVNYFCKSNVSVRFDKWTVLLSVRLLTCTCTYVKIWVVCHKLESI